MKIPVNTLLIACAVGIGLGVGYALRETPTPGGEETSVTTTAPPADSPQELALGSKQRDGIRSQKHLPLATQLERDLSMSSGVTRWLYWLAAIEKAAPSHFSPLIRLAPDEPEA